MAESNGTGHLSPADRRAAILARAGKRETRPSTLLGLDGEKIDVLVRELTGAEAREFEIAVAKDIPAPIGYLLQMSLVDPETKELLFEPADREALESLGIGGLNPSLKVAAELNGLSDADIAKAKASLRLAP